MKKIVVLGIDLQKDFTSPSGTLFVQGADADISRIANFICNNQTKIDYIALTLDSHQPIHIAHQIYWKDKEGNHPSLFSVISVQDVKNGIWNAQYNKELAVVYLEQLNKKGECCTIWPMHCIQGTSGWALDKTVMDSLKEWAVNNNKSYDLFYKGYSQTTEHYSIFKAAVEWDHEPHTSLNKDLLTRLNKFDEVILVGEAADYCVAKSLNDILDECDELAKKMVVLSDCMSWIDPDNRDAKLIFERAINAGVKFTTSKEYML